jgi:DNA-binding response OmpR family regulator
MHDSMKKVFYPTKKKAILIVEDEQSLADTYGDELRGHGFQVDVAINSANARHKLRNAPIDLVLLDLSLPGPEGIEALKQIRAESGAEALPIIVFLNSFLARPEKAIQEAGATQCVTKACCTAGQLLEIVREVLAASPLGAAAGLPSAVPPGDLAVLEFQAKLVSTLLINGPEILATVRASHYALVKTEQEDLRRAELSDMRRQMHSLGGLAGLAGFRTIAQLASALEALFIELHARPPKTTPSVIRTVAQAIDTLAFLFDQTAHPYDEVFLPPRILVVDDEIISRETICCALGKAGLAAIRLDDSFAAQRLLEQEPFDLIFLDVEMPEKSGLELCVHIRSMPTNRTTPVVFVTGHSDFGSRAQSALSGGNDFIAKPFLLLELAIKALTWLFKEHSRPVVPAVAPEGVMAGTSSHEPQPSTSYPALELHRELRTA